MWRALRLRSFFRFSAASILLIMILPSCTFRESIPSRSPQQPSGDLSDERHSAVIHEEGIASLAFSSHSQTLASASSDHQIRLWDLETRGLKRVLSGHRREVKSVAFSPDGILLASGSHDGTVWLWDAGSGSPVKSLPGDRKISVTTVLFLPDSKMVASGKADGKVILWDVETGTVFDALIIPLNKGG